MQDEKHLLDIIWSEDASEIQEALGPLDVNTPIGNSYPLEIAALRAFPDLEVIKILIGLGANPNKTIANGQTIIAEAKRLNRPADIISELEKASLRMKLNEKLSGKSGDVDRKPVLKI